jgi:Fic family protein
VSNFAPSRPYNSLPLLPPSGEIETKAVLKACIEARAAIAALKQCGGLIPNQGMLINTIPVLEAQASSAIENIVTTADRLFQFANTSDTNVDAATKEALRYGKALYSGFKSLAARPLTKQTAIEVCSTIKGVEMEIRRVPGTALIEANSGRLIYTPPEGESILKEKLDNWEKFIHEATEYDPLVRLALMHYQFEAIHPFTDGNGRTGRVLNILLLVDLGLLDIPVLYLSRYIIQHKQEYYQYLAQIPTHGNWEQWILFMLDAIVETARWTTAKIQSIRQLMEITTEYVRINKPKIYNRDLLDLIFIQPYCRIANVVDANIVKRQTAATHLRELCDIGVLKEAKVGREKLFIHPRFLQLLTAEDHTVDRY